MRCQEGGGDHVPGLSTRTGSTLLFSTTARFCDIKQRRNGSFLTSSSVAAEGGGGGGGGGGWGVSSTPKNGIGGAEPLL